MTNGIRTGIGLSRLCLGLVDCGETYQLRIAEGSPLFSSASVPNRWNEIATHISGNQVTFSTEFDSHLAVHVVGSAKVETPITTISIPLSGYIQYCLNSPMFSSFVCSGNQAAPRCDSRNHRLILDRR